jgi:hypothetical protein
MADPRLIRTTLAAVSSATVGAPGHAITATGSGPAASSAIAPTSTSPGTNKLSAPAALYTAARSSAAATPAPIDGQARLRKISVRALIQTGTSLAAARAAASRSACSAAPKSETPSRRSSRFTPTAPARTTAATVVATASGESPYPASISADTGTETAAAIRPITAAARSASSPAASGTPSDHATPALVVAIAFAPQPRPLPPKRHPRHWPAAAVLPPYASQRRPSALCIRTIITFRHGMDRGMKGWPPARTASWPETSGAGRARQSIADRAGGTGRACGWLSAGGTVGLLCSD